jgi:hypothetical protein
MCQITGRLLTLAALAVLIGGAVLGAAQEASPRATVPDDAALSRALEALKRQHEAEYARAEKDPAARVALAEALLEKARQLKKDAAAHFVALREARDLAAGAGSAAVAFQAVDDMGRDFTVDVAAQRTDLVTKLVPALRSTEAARELVDTALGLAAEAIEEDQHDRAERLAAAAERAARKAKDLPLVLSVQRFERGVRATKEQFARIKPFADKLRQDPEDPDANRQMGRYHALLKGDWERGLFLLAQGNDPALRRLAQRDLARPEDVKEQVEMGDAWWQQADKESDQARIYLRQRAVYWYEMAAPAAEAAVRERLEQRIASVPRPRARPSGWDYAGPARELHVLRGHNNAVFAVAFSPDGRKVLSGSVDHRAML